MSLKVRRSDWFVGDLEHCAAWCQREASWQVAQHYLRAVGSTLLLLADTPGLGRLARFSALVLYGLRLHPVERPFGKRLIFYRHDEEAIYMERLVHGARDLPRRVIQPPAAAES